MAPDMLADPETDPTATYAVDPALARRLTARVVCSPRAEQRLTRSPFGGAPLASLPLSTLADVEAAVSTARAAQRAWARTPVEHRERVLLRYHDLVLDRQAEFLDLAQLESGKTRRQAFEEVADVALVSRYYARTGKVTCDPRRPGLFPVLTQTRSCTTPRASWGSSRPGTTP